MAAASKNQQHSPGAIPIHQAEVVARRSLTPQMNRITLGGGTLSTYEAKGADEFLYVFFPVEGKGPPVADDFTWDMWRAQPEADRTVGRYYTVRRRDSVARTLDIDVVLHGGGPGATWGATTEPGDRVSFWGPRWSWNPPGDMRLLLMVADQTGLPAVGAVLEQLPVSVSARVLLLVPDEGEQQSLPARAGIDVQWLYGEGPAAEQSLVAAVKDGPIPVEHGYVWAAGEREWAFALRSWLQDVRRVEPARIEAVGYWHRQDGHG